MKIESVDYQSPHAAQDFVESLHSTGFGVLRNHPIPQSLVSDIYQSWHAFFGSEEKHHYHFNVETQDGYFPPNISEVAKGAKVKDIKEYYHVYPHGQIPPALEQQINTYREIALRLAAELLNWVESCTPENIRQCYSQPLPQMIENSQRSLLRVLHYPPLSGQEEAGAIRAAAHEDINLLTILPAANEPGLQVKGKNKQWFDVPCEFGNLIINIGDMLQEASSGYFPSTSHRVINPNSELEIKKSRISLPFFLHPRKEVVLSQRHTAGSYLDERLRELGVK